MKRIIWEGVLAAAFVATSGLACGTALAAPVIPNASFEEPGFVSMNPFVILGPGSTFITGWTVGGAGLDYFDATVPERVSDGNYSVNYIRGPNQGGTISTTITDLDPGTEYALSFDLNQLQLVPGTALTATVATTTQTFLNAVSGVYVTQTILFTATETTAPLIFAGPATGAVDSALAHIDNVRITAVPLPGALVLFGCGLFALSPLRRTNTARRSAMTH